MHISECENVKSRMDMSYKVIKMYEWLLDLYVLDFFVDDHWGKLPNSWREGFINIDPQVLGEMILSSKYPKQLLPLSLLALVKSVQVLSIPRENSNGYYIKKTVHNARNCKNHPRLKNLFLKHVKLKKRHEISLMAKVVVDTAENTGCNAVIDFGSGLGHLVRVLAYSEDLFAVGIECQSQLTQEARKLDMELEYTAKKHLSAEVKLKQPLHYNVNLSNHHQLLELSLPESMCNYGLIGLHPCGDLGPLLLKHFVESDHVKFICVVGCCYMKLTDVGYPMSSHAKSLDCKLSYPSREIACHAIEVYCERLRRGSYEDLKIHAYRAALERILQNLDPKLHHAPVRSIKHSDTMSFEKYCALAIERLNLQLPKSPDIWCRANSDLQQWRKVVVVYTLRLALAPLVETVILLDRMLYIMEKGLSCEIRPVFDPKLSPRNHIIIGRR